MARLFADENFPKDVVVELRRPGHDVVTIQDAGMANQKIDDERVLAAAHADAWAVLTINRKDFIRLHRRQPLHGGIILCTEDSDFAGQATRIHAAIGSRDQLAGDLIRVNRPLR